MNYAHAVIDSSTPAPTVIVKRSGTLGPACPECGVQEMYGQKVHRPSCSLLQHVYTGIGIELYQCQK